MNDGRTWTPEASIRSAAAALAALAADARLIAGISQLAGEAAECLKAGGKILACGNGGSACDAAHFAEELTGRFRNDRPPLAAIACTDIGHITCTANDFGYEHVFARWVEALAQRGDLVVLLSTSGNSPSIVNAAHAAKRCGARTAALLGGGGGAIKGTAELELIVPGAGSDRIQELHMLILHMVVEGIEHALFGRS